MITYVVNLPRRRDRKRQFLAWNGRHALSYCFAEAVDGSTVPRHELVAAGILGEPVNVFSDGAIGCALSHRALWEICARAGDVNLIVEDDACIRHDFVEAFEAIRRRTGDGWDIFFVGYNTDGATTIRPAGSLTATLIFDESAKIAPFFDDFAGGSAKVDPPTIASVSLVWGTLAYAVTARGAERLLQHCFPMSTDIKIATPFQGELPAVGIDGMISNAIQRQLVSALCCFPPLVLGPNDKATSDIASPAASGPCPVAAVQPRLKLG
jgi:glycosyl transferase, family 25